jgi:hypothetical protein
MRDRFGPGRPADDGRAPARPGSSRVEPTSTTLTAPVVSVFGHAARELTGVETTNEMEIERPTFRSEPPSSERTMPMPTKVDTQPLPAQILMGRTHTLEFPARSPWGRDEPRRQAQEPAVEPRPVRPSPPPVRVPPGYSGSFSSLSPFTMAEDGTGTTTGQVRAPRSARARALVWISSGVALATLAALVVVARSPSASRPLSATASAPEPKAAPVAEAPIVAATPTPTPAPTPAPTPTPTPPPAALVPAASASVGGGQTLLVLPKRAHGHRIYVDSRVVSSGDKPVKVGCGAHTLRIGSAGRPQVVDLPCGGQHTVD